MTIFSDGEDLEFSCDYPGCDSTGYYSAENFSESWDEAKEAGWRAFKNDQGDWEHRCPDHVGMVD